jgi:hypothetical protein
MKNTTLATIVSEDMSTIENDTAVDYSHNKYTWDVYPGVVFWFVDHPEETVYGPDGEFRRSEKCTDMAIICMVGDNKKFIVYLDELEIYKDNVCSCGQVGCQW